MMRLIYRTDYRSILNKGQYDALYQTLVSLPASKQIVFKNHFIDTIKKDFHEQGLMLSLKEYDSHSKILFSQPKTDEQVLCRLLDPVPFNLKNLLFFRQFQQVVFDEDLNLSFRGIRSPHFKVIGITQTKRLLIRTSEIIIKLDENIYSSELRDYEITVGVCKGDFNQVKGYFHNFLESFRILPINPVSKYERFLLNNNIS